MNAPVKFLLDTDISSYAMKGTHPRLQAKLEQLPPESVAISVITKAELSYGLKRLSPTNRLHIDVADFISLTTVLDWPSDAADIYADIRHNLKFTGQNIGDLDMMIAAHALAIDATLVSNNTRHYARVHLPLKLENWA